jgi:UDP-glucose 4-epimerase
LDFWIYNKFSTNFYKNVGLLYFVNNNFKAYKFSSTAVIYEKTTEYEYPEKEIIKLKYC